MTVTHALNTDELANLLVDNIYTDSEVGTHEGYVSLHSSSTMTHAFVWSQPHDIIGFTIHLYDKLMAEAAPSGYTPLFIVATPEGVYEFNMSVIEPKFETYSSDDEPDVLVSDIPISKGKRILDFYPDFASQEEYLDTLMSDSDEAW